MGPLEKSILNKLEETFLGDVFELTNESHMHSSGLGGESHFKLLIISELFGEMSRVERQQKIHGLLKTEFAAGVHALSLRLLTPEENEKKNSKFKSPPCASQKSPNKS